MDYISYWINEYRKIQLTLNPCVNAYSKLDFKIIGLKEARAILKYHPSHTIDEAIQFYRNKLKQLTSESNKNTNIKSKIAGLEEAKDIVILGENQWMLHYKKGMIQSG